MGAVEIVDGLRRVRELPCQDSVATGALEHVERILEVQFDKHPVWHELGIESHGMCHSFQTTRH